MPDQDIFKRQFSKSWKRSAKQIRAGLNAEDAAAVTANALSKDLKDMGGIRNLPELCEMITAALSSDSENESRNLLAKLRAIGQSYHDRQFAAGVTKAAWETYSVCSTNDSNHALFPTMQEIAERFCSNYIQIQLHSKLGLLFETGKANKWENENFQKEYRKCLDLHTKKIAKSLTNDPSYKKHPKFSRMKWRRRSTAEILNKPLPLS